MKKSIQYLLINLLFIAFFTSSCEFNLNTAHIENVQACTSLAGDQCGGDQTFFQTNSPQVVVSCELKNPPTDTKVEFTWNYLSNGVTKIDAVTLNSGDKIGTVNMHSSLSRPNNGWPVGDYEVIIKILDTDKEPTVKKFYVK